jgi:hypothetical protein
MYIRSNGNGTYRVTFPDFNGCFSDVKRRSYLSSAFIRTVERYLHENNVNPAAASRPEEWFFDKRFQGGYWMLARINPQRPPAIPSQGAPEDTGQYRIVMPDTRY